MPCSDGGCYRDDGELRRKLDKVTDLLCAVSQVIEDAQPPSVRDQVMVRLEEVPGLLSWWRNHQREDAARLLRETRQQAEARQRIIDQVKRLEQELEDLDS